MSKKTSTIGALLLTIFLSMPGLASAATCYEASGFGNSSANGTYNIADTYNSADYFTNSNGYYLFSHPAGTDYWAIHDALDTAGTPSSYYNNTDAPPADPFSTWNVDGGTGNTPPAGTIGACSSPPGPAGSTTLYYVDNPTQDLFYGYILFLAGMTLIIWILRGRKTH